MTSATNGDYNGAKGAEAALPEVPPWSEPESLPFTEELEEGAAFIKEEPPISPVFDGPSLLDQAYEESPRSPEPWQPTPPEATAGEPIDFSDVIAQTNIEMKRLGWTSEQGRRHLLQTYGKRSRQLLSDEELLEFLQHLQQLPA